MELTSQALYDLITMYANNMGEYPEVITMHPDAYHKFCDDMATRNVMVQDDTAAVGLAQFYGIPILPKRKAPHDYVLVGRMRDVFPER